MKQLKLPPYSYRLKESSGGKQIFDPVRRRYVALTPEEWVRQHFINYLAEVLKYPKGLIRVEASFRLNKMLRRADILVCDRKGEPVMIVECKAPEVNLTRQVFEQIFNYNLSFGVRYLVVTNGLVHFSGVADTERHRFILLDHIPDYESVNSQTL